MGVDLMGHGGASFNWASWRSLLDIAVAFGWQPAKTVMPDKTYRGWSGTYCSNDFQKVTDQDARELSAALYQAIAAILSPKKALTAEQAEAIKGEGIQNIRLLADYAAKGGFAIY